MKAVLTFLLLITGFTTKAQSNYYSVFTDNNDYHTWHLEVLPWDQSKLVQIKRDWDTLHQYFEHWMEDISTTFPVPIGIPGCNAIVNRPVFLESGILTAGETNSSGIELIYFDGTSTTVFDINPGSIGSDPEIEVIQGSVFVTAKYDTVRTLYEFNENAVSIGQVSSGSDNVTRACAKWGNNVYYQTKNNNDLTAEYVHRLEVAEWNGGNYNYSTVREMLIPYSSSNSAYWREPLVKWGKLFLAEESYNFFANHPNTVRMISVDANDVSVVLKEFLQISGGSNMRLVEKDSKIYSYVTMFDTVYSLMDGGAVVPEFNVPDTKVENHYISEDNRLFFKLYHNTPPDDHELVEYDGNSLTSRLTDSHLHVMYERDNVMYISNYNYTTETSSLYLYHTQFGIHDSIGLPVGYHDPVDGAALFYQGYYTFLFRDYPTTDVYQLIGSPMAGLNEEQQQDLILSPNPVLSEGIVYFNTSLSGKYTIFGMDGKRVAQGTLPAGSQQVRLPKMEAGVYLFKLNGSTLRLEVN